MKIKVCGMGSPENILEVAALQPDYLGFIFFERSARNFIGIIPNIPESIKKTGVFVNESFEFIHDKIIQFKLKAVQLHGEESVQLCEQLMELDIEVIKVFSIKGNFNFNELTSYESVVDYFLFDTKGEHPGGNGYVFDWNVLKDYPSKTPFFLSGGIGPEELDAVKEIINSDLPVYALDLNSKFETEPSCKDANLLKEFLNNI